MTTIFKYPLELIDDNIIEIPKGAKILTIQNQHETLCIWAEIDPTQKMNVELLCCLKQGNLYLK